MCDKSIKKTKNHTRNCVNIEMKERKKKKSTHENPLNLSVPRIKTNKLFVKKE